MSLRLVKRLMLRRDVREEKRILVGLLRFCRCAPNQIRAPRDVAAIELVVGIHVIPGLKFFRHSGVKDESYTCTAELPDLAAVDIPCHQPRHSSTPAQND